MTSVLHYTYHFRSLSSQLKSKTKSRKSNFYFRKWRITKSRCSAWWSQQKLMHDPSDPSNQTSWRKANLTCKIAIDNLEKAELLQGGDPLRQRKTTKGSLAQTSSAITESLMGISRMMSQQVQQSQQAMQTLVNSSRTILDANEEFKSMSGTIQLGRKLITKYNRRELTDKLLIFLALALFLATVLYIMKKRLFPFL
ncbi:PREDICTED: vesicle transport protein SEC20 isoform X2 [Galeopterus variegatus]|uniref:Vesicle transport protein SEC20 isoform X2 n=1 Tax=Galeopterus variegatus TaxID=482537 RepID=A0ABM0QIR6_GALVR|nr:PREDICTED: vesicle transport protein SEC20 isoform X2 [Galeopterus variegatus]